MFVLVLMFVDDGAAVGVDVDVGSNAYCWFRCLLLAQVFRIVVGICYR